MEFRSYSASRTQILVLGIQEKLEQPLSIWENKGQELDPPYQAHHQVGSNKKNTAARM